MNDIVYQHEVIVPDRGLPFKLFLFEGGGGKYIREKPVSYTHLTLPTT